MSSDPDSQIDIRPASPGDIAAIVALQVVSLDGSLVTALGPAFLTRFHAAALEHPSTRVFVAIGPGDAVVGFLLASIDLEAFNQFVKRRVLLSLVRALFAPGGWRYAMSFAGGLAEREPRPSIPANLLLLFVDSRVRRRGVARRLLAQLDEAFAAEGVSRYRVAVRKHLAGARAFYLAEGFEQEQELPVLRHPMMCLTKRVWGRAKGEQKADESGYSV
jgi:GNAT superfamily N-acetyltransferase